MDEIRLDAGVDEDEGEERDEDCQRRIWRIRLHQIWEALVEFKVGWLFGEGLVCLSMGVFFCYLQLC
jgi:hypothetical protein